MNKAKPRPLIAGVGINDANYHVQKTVNGKTTRCPYYRKWTGMLHRCYGKATQRNQPEYHECSVHPDWHRFSTFKTWMEQQDWQGKALDKDILFPSNKQYGPDTCIFISQVVNNLMTGGVNRRTSTKQLPEGVRHEGKRFVAIIQNEQMKPQRLGTFSCPNQAHRVYRNRKAKKLLHYAQLQVDERLKKALINHAQRYAAVPLLIE